CDGTQFQCTGGAYVELLGSRVAERLRAFDVWGNAYRVASSWSGFTLQSSGPDEVAQSQDDATFAFAFSDLGVQVPTQDWWNEGGVPTADGGWADGATATGGTGGASAGNPTPEPGGGNAGG